MMDNQIFRVNGEDDDSLLKVLELVFDQGGHQHCTSYTHDSKYGLVLHWDKSEGVPFPSPMSASEILPVVRSWLNSDKADNVELVGDEQDLEHDGHNTRGWLVYVERWGYVGGFKYTICAVKSVFLWRGK
jgi:hypothetical protein